MPRRGENIRKRKDGRWEARVKISVAPYNTTKYKYLYGKTYKEVKVRAHNYVHESQVSVEQTDIGETVNDIAFCWLIKVKNTRKYSTYVKYLNIYEKHIKPYIGEKEIHTIDDEILLTLLKERYNYGGINRSNLSISTIKSIRYVLFSILSNMKATPLELITGSFYTKDNASIEIFISPEQYQIINYLKNHIDTFNLGILIAFYTGIRLGELCALKYEDIDLMHRTISIRQTVQRIKTSSAETKTELRCTKPKSAASERIIPICDELFCILCNNLSKGVYVVNGNKLMEPRTYQYKFKKILQTLTIQEHSFHTIRHTFATNCIDNGMNIKCLSEILGHSDVKTTMNRYVHPSLESKMNQINQCISYSGQK